MMYKIVISVEKEKDERGYNSYDEIYSQRIPDINVLSVIKAANGIEYPKEK